MHHSKFDFILDKKNIQTINKLKTQDCYTIIKKTILPDFNFALFFRYTFLFSNKENELTSLKQLLAFRRCLTKKYFFFPKCRPYELKRKKYLPTNRLYFLCCFARRPIN